MKCSSNSSKCEYIYFCLSLTPFIKVRKVKGAKEITVRTTKTASISEAFSKGKFITQRNVECLGQKKKIFLTFPVVLTFPLFQATIYLLKPFSSSSSSVVTRSFTLFTQFQAHVLLMLMHYEFIQIRSFHSGFQRNHSVILNVLNKFNFSFKFNCYANVVKNSISLKILIFCSLCKIFYLLFYHLCIDDLEKAEW